MDGVKSVTISEDGISLEYAEFKLVAHKPANGPEFEDSWQRPEEDGTSTFLLTDAAELATVKSDLDRYGITFDPETNVALTARQKELLNSSGIRSRSGLSKELERLERIDAATTFEQLKDEVLKINATSSRAI